MAEQRTCNAKVVGSSPSSGTIPTVLAVPLPTGHFKRNHGVRSLKHSTAERIIFRIGHNDREMIKQVAKVLEMTEAQFVREAAKNMAKVIVKLMEKHNADAGDRSG